MASFVRFVFTIVIVGMAINLAIVLVANARSHKRLTLQYQEDTERFREMVDNVAGHVRRADIIVESQRIDGRDNPLETTLLVRQYRATGTSQDEPLPVVRITIPGNQLQATGLMLEFDHFFAADKPQYEVLRNKQLVFFDRFCGAGETASTQPNTEDTRFTFLPPYHVPELIRLRPQDPQPSPFEIGLWQYLWDYLSDAKFPRVSTPLDPTLPGTRFVDLLVKGDFATAVAQFDAAMKTALPEDKLRSTWQTLPQQAGPFQKQLRARTATQANYKIVLVTCQFQNAYLEARVVFDADGHVAGLFFEPSRGINATWLQPATIAVLREHTYTAFVSIDGIITLSQDEPGITTLMRDMEEAGKSLPPP